MLILIFELVQYKVEKMFPAFKFHSVGLNAIEHVGLQVEKTHPTPLIP